MQIYKRERICWQVKNSKLLEMYFFYLANLLVANHKIYQVKNIGIFEHALLLF
jgi:hypothetical protein